MIRIDAHVHVWIPENEYYPFTPKRSKADLFEGSAEVLLNVMERNNVSHAVLVQPGIYGSDNSYMMDSFDKYPGKFAAICRVDQSSKSAPADLEFWVKKRGAQGIRILLGQYTPETWNHGKPEYPLWEKIRELGIAVGYLIVPGQASMVEDMLKQFPEVPVILDHLGKPVKEESPEYPGFQNILRLAAYPQVYIKLSALSFHSKEKYPYKDMLVCAEKAVNAFKPGRVMWATDFCATLGAHNYHTDIELLEQHMPFLSDSDKDWIYAKTALKLFKF